MAERVSIDPQELDAALARLVDGNAYTPPLDGPLPADPDPDSAENDPDARELEEARLPRRPQWRDRHGRWIDMPPAPGESPIPEGHVRLYHYTQKVDAVDDIAREGIRVNRSRGETYGEPNVVWASRRQPDERLKEFVEFSVPKTEEPAVGGFSHEASDSAFARDIKPEEIIAVHKPWFASFRYLMENYPTGDDQGMNLDSYLEPDQFDPELTPAVRLWRQVTSEPPPEPQASPEVFPTVAPPDVSLLPPAAREALAKVRAKRAEMDAYQEKIDAAFRAYMEGKRGHQGIGRMENIQNDKSRELASLESDAYRELDKVPGDFDLDRWLKAVEDGDLNVGDR